MAYLKRVKVDGQVYDIYDADALHDKPVVIKTYTTATASTSAEAEKIVINNVPTKAIYDAITKNNNELYFIQEKNNYAGASTDGGSATSALRLTSNAGSATQPVYFAGGVPIATTHTLEADVPADAVFTDTVYSLPTASSSVLGGVKIGTNIGISSGTISVANGSTSAKGVVQLSNTTNSTSTSLAATANAVKQAYDLANDALPKGGGTLTGSLTLSGAPTEDLHAATKKYVDDTLASASSGASTSSESEIPFVAGTQTTTTGSFTGNAPTVSALTDGLTIRYWLPYPGSGSATLNLILKNGTATGAKNIYWYGTTRLTTHYTAGSIIILTYRENVTIGTGTTKYTGWWCLGDYNSTNTNQMRNNGGIKIGTAISANTIVGADENNLYHKITSLSAINLLMPIYYVTAAVSANGTNASPYFETPATIAATQSMTLTAYKPLYLKGTLSGHTFTPASTTAMTQTIPTQADGFQYLFIGVAYSGTSLYLLANHPVYEFKDGVFQEVHDKYSALGRTNAVDQEDTNYTSYIARGESLNDSETNPTVNGTIAWELE